MITLPKVIGLPPSLDHDKSQIKLLQSFPVMKVYPMEPDFGKAFQVYRLRPAMKQFQGILQKYGFSINTGFQYLELAFINEGSISESFSSDFGDSFVESMANAVSDKFLDARQLLGIGSVKEMEAKINQLGNKAADSLGFAEGAIRGATETVNKILKAGDKSPFWRSVKNVLIGNKIDMPSIWKGSSASMDYGVTIRLYNPYPGNEEMYQKYIVGPLVTLLLFVMPRSNDGVSYRWPFYCKIEAPGMFFLKYAAIKDMSVTKGGDSAAFTYDQRPTLVDVKLTFSELHNVRMVMENGQSSDSGIPTLRDYIENMTSFKMSSLDGHYTPEAILNVSSPQFAEDEKLDRMSKLKTSREQRQSIQNNLKTPIKRVRKNGPPPISKGTEQKIYGIPVSDLKNYRKKVNQHEEDNRSSEDKAKEYINKNYQNPYGISENDMEKIRKAQDPNYVPPDENDRVEDPKEEAEDRINDKKLEQTAPDKDPNDNIQRIGNNSYIDNNSKKIVLSRSDTGGNEYLYKRNKKRLQRQYPDYEIKEVP